MNLALLTAWIAAGCVLLGNEARGGLVFSARPPVWLTRLLVAAGWALFAALWWTLPGDSALFPVLLLLLAMVALSAGSLLLPLWPRLYGASLAVAAVAALALCAHAAMG